MNVARACFGLIPVLLAGPSSTCGGGGSDAGATDAGSASDAGGGTDATGPADAGAPDATQPGDAGPPQDAAIEASGDAAGDGGFATAAHLPFPPVTLVSDAGIIGGPRIVSIVLPEDPEYDDLLAFGQQVPQSAWFSAWEAQYGAGPPRASQSLFEESIGGSMPDGGYTQAQMNQAIGDAITGDNSLIAPDGHTIFVLYLPENTYFEYGGQPGSCQYFAYHSPYGTMGDGAAYVSRCGTAPLDGSELGNATRMASHEIAEAVTDTGGIGWNIATSSAQPWAGSIWGTADGQFLSEVGDLCGLQTRVTEGSYSYQRIYSNAALPAHGDPCVPALPTTYYNTSVPQGWYPVTAGGSVDIPVTGWSSAPIAGGWLLTGSTRVQSTPAAGWSYFLSTSGPTFGGVPYHAIDNGQTATLKVSAPASAPHGAFISIMILSVRLDADGGYLAGEDFGHRWLVGAYVP
ncbi:MAG TPA: hypothetical protein VGG39_27375 [Polyangiaceae bacterium]